MKTEMKKFKFFTVTEYEKEQEYLQNQHKLGWKLTSISLIGLYHFEKCEPEDVVYQLDYNKDGDASKGNYVQMFKDCGWEYLMDFLGYSYFRKPVSEVVEDEEIFCDDSSRLDMIRRVFQGKIVPLFVIFSLIIVPQMSLQFYKGEPSDMIVGAMFMVLFVLYMTMFIQFGVKYFKLKKSL